MLDCCFQLLFVVACYLLCIVSSIMFLNQSTIKLSSRAKGPIIVIPLLSHTNLPLVAHCCSLTLYIKNPIVYIGVSCPCTRALGFLKMKQ